MPFSFGFGNKSVFSKGNKSSIVTDNLVYQIDPSNTLSYPGSGTTVTDISGQGNTATLVNGAAFSSNQFSFDGVNDIINITHSASLNLGQAFTVGAWVRANALGNTTDPFGANINAIGNRQIIYSTRVNNTAGCFQLELTGTTVSITGVGTFVISAGTIAANTWYYIVYARDGSGSGTIYINGVAQTPSTTTAYTFVDNSDTKQIGGGGSTGTGQPFNGRIGDLHLYRRALSQQEILQNYSATSSKYAQSIVSQNLVLHLDASNASSYPGTGTTWTDLSGGNRHATLQSAMPYSAEGGGSIQFADNKYATVSGGTAIFAGNAYTKSVWVKFTSTANFKNLISGDGNSHAFWVPASWETVVQKLAGGHNNSWRSVVGATTITANVWYNFSMTFSTTNGLRVYINGVLDGSNAAATAPISTTSGPLYLGTFAVLNNGFSGFMGSAFIYTKELTAEELLQNFNATRSRFGV